MRVHNSSIDSRLELDLGFSLGTPSRPLSCVSRLLSFKKVRCYIKEKENIEKKRKKSRTTPHFAPRVKECVVRTTST